MPVEARAPLDRLAATTSTSFARDARGWLAMTYAAGEVANHDEKKA